MIVRRAAGCFLLAVLGFLWYLTVTYGTWRCHDAAWNSDGAWDFHSLDAGVAALGCWVAISVLGLVLYACFPSRRSACLLVAVSVTALLLPMLGDGVRRHRWQGEFDGNRRQVEAVIEALQDYQQEHGTYPASLKSLPRPLATTLHRGQHGHELEYWRTGPGGFVLQYSYGWYTYKYDSRAAGWQRFD